MKLVVFPAVEHDRVQKIQSAAGEMMVSNVTDEKAAVGEIVDADALFGKLTPTILAAARKLRWVQSPTSDLSHYVFPELVEHPCVLTNMRGLFSDVIADHVFGLMLCFARNLHRYIRQQVDGHWFPIGADGAATQRSLRDAAIAGAGVITTMDRTHFHLGDCTLGVVGLGGIGTEVTRRAVALGMRVVVVDPVKDSAPNGVETLWRPDQLSNLLAESDFVVIAAPHTPATEKMFRRPQLRQMKTTAYLINIGRGVIVDLQDLVAALNAGEIAGAGLDVFETEPLPTDHPLWRMENVIITPHVAAASMRIAERHLEVLLDNIRRFVCGEPLQNVADKEAWF